uniref:Dehydration responsive element binding protein 1D n=1 Tax=Lilium longiflorum TaxID=4690 RepID=A0A6M3W844_LILLO|nr:dehydration responsive element binding protein 1D [Lilium longiflorum]
MDHPDCHASASPSSSSSIAETCCYTTVSSSPPKRRAGRTKFQETRHPLYRGVRRRGMEGHRWVCELRDPNNNKSRLWLGTFPTAEMAARAHDVAALALRGPSAILNFADSAWLLPIPPASYGRAAIQRAAAEAARAFHRPSGDDNITSAAPNTHSESTSWSAMTIENKAIEFSGDPLDTMEYEGSQASYYASMAEGLLIDPPSLTSIGGFLEDVDSGIDFSLWNYS